MTSLLKELLDKRGIAMEENQEDKAPSGAEVNAGTGEPSATPETPTASPDVVDDTAIHGEPGTNGNQAPDPAEGGTADPETPAPQTDENGTQGQEDGGAAGASEEGGLGEPQVSEDDLQAQAVEADEEVEQADVDEAEEAVKEAEVVTATMESLIERIKEIHGKGGLTAREAAIAQTRASKVLSRMGLPEVLFPSQESFGAYGERAANTLLVASTLEKHLDKANELKTQFVTIRDKRVAAFKK